MCVVVALLERAGARCKGRESCEEKPGTAKKAPRPHTTTAPEAANQLVSRAAQQFGSSAIHWPCHTVALYDGVYYVIQQLSPSSNRMAARRHRACSCLLLALEATRQALRCSPPPFPPPPPSPPSLLLLLLLLLSTSSSRQHKGSAQTGSQAAAHSRFPPNVSNPVAANSATSYLPIFQVSSK